MFGVRVFNFLEVVFNFDMFFVFNLYFKEFKLILIILCVLLISMILF